MLTLLHGMTVIAADSPKKQGTIDGLLTGIAPNWGPFKALETPAQQVIGVLMAGVILFLLGTAAVGAMHIKVGNSQANTMETKKGQTQVASALVGLFVVAALVTIFTIVYGMGNKVR
ncbi:hypothetical protein ACH4VR_29280 [Streptomyces sp. NPDC020883]|uniref:hypothetical protein n=1 Tax=Streptomyces sp. NPDC020883 TaxID=3365099 RepID=UPI0037AF5331